MFIEQLDSQQSAISLLSDDKLKRKKSFFVPFLSHRARLATKYFDIYKRNQ